MNTNIEKQYLRKSYLYLSISFLTILFLNLVILFFYRISNDPDAKNVGSQVLIISVFYLVFSITTLLISLKKSHFYLFSNIKNDSLTYLFLPFLTLILLYQRYIFNFVYVILTLLVIVLVVKISIFTSIFFKKKHVIRKSELATYLVLLTVLLLSILSKKGIDLNTKLHELVLPPAGIEISKENPIYTLSLDDELDSDGLIMVSCLASAPNVDQGTIIGHIRLFDRHGEKVAYSICAGEETSELGFGFPAVKPYIHHKQTRIYASKLSNVAGVDYIQAFEYKQRFDFEKPIDITSIQFEFVMDPDFPDPVKLIISRLYYFKNKRTEV